MRVKGRNPENTADWCNDSNAGLPRGRATVHWGRVDTAEPGMKLGLTWHHPVVPRGSKWTALKESILDLCSPFILFVFRLRVSNYLLLIKKPSSQGYGFSSGHVWMRVGL